MAKEEKALAVADASQFAVCTMKQDITEVIKSNLGEGAKVQVTSLDQVKVPSQGSVFWNYETIDGDVSEKELLGVIVHVANIRAYWSVSYDDSGGGSPPDCTSFDLIHGNASDPEIAKITGGYCPRCPYSQFGTSRGKDGGFGRGQACQERKWVFLVMKDGALPYVINVPPSSLNNIQKFMLRLSSHGMRYYERVARFTLEKAQNLDGVNYSKIVLGVAGPVPNPEFWRDYSNKLAPLLQSTAQKMTEEMTQDAE